MTKQEYYNKHQFKSKCPYCGKEFSLSLFTEEIVVNQGVKCSGCGNTITISSKDKSCYKFEEFLKSQISSK
jgi:DNA-directed RNA polymerase subunit RPC12/RpoP